MKLRSFVRPAAALAFVLAATACGNRDEATAPESGMLVVVVNTPVDHGAAVLIRGPNASTAHLTSTDTLRGLTPGQYSARAQNLAVADSLVSPVLTGAVSDSLVMVAADTIASVTATYVMRGGSGAMWVSKWGSLNLAEGFTSAQLALAGSRVAADTIGTAASALTSSGAAFDSAGNLWVTNYIAQQILKFTPAQLASGESTPTVAIATSKEPWGIAFDGHGNLWVSYYNGNNVLEYDASDVAGWSGALTDPTPARTISTPNGPLSIAFDSHGDLWVAGFDVPITYRIAQSSLETAGSIVPTDSLVSPFLSHGSGLAFDRAGNLWEGTESGYLLGYTAAQLSSASHGGPTFAQQGSSYSFDALAFDNSGNLWAATETPDVAMYAPAQQASGDISAPARTLTASTGERTFGLAFDAHDALLPIASTVASSGAIVHVTRAGHGPGARRAAPPVVHLRDGSRPGSVLHR